MTGKGNRNKEWCSSPILVTLMKEAPDSSETSALTRATRRNIPEDTILHSYRRENLKSYGNRNTLRNLAPLPLWRLQMPHEFTRARSRVGVMGSRRLTAWATALGLGQRKRE
jgi:hypothetical protein